jgi:hypothetical protein
MAYEPSQDRPGQGTDDSEPILPEQEPSNRRDRESGNRLLPADAARPSGRREGVVSDPDR